MGLADLRFTLWNVHGLLSTVGELQEIAAGADVIIATEFGQLLELMLQTWLVTRPFPALESCRAVRDAQMVA